ncbi:unnamed protein product [Aureobasidium pullulans]|nr:unnamed protein product [Aureobasidium pullulans]
MFADNSSGLVGTVPIYLSEISSPEHRGLIGGISGCGIAFGTMEFLKIRRDLHPQSAYQEFALMRAQIEYEVEREVKSYKEIFKLFRHRALVSIAVHTFFNPSPPTIAPRGKYADKFLSRTMTSLTGVNVIQVAILMKPAILYKSLGIGSKQILALAGVYGTVAFFSNAITTTYLTDQWGRRKMILTGLGGIVLVEIYAAVMQREFQQTDNQVGKGFAILGIYLLSTTWLYGAEVLPIALRSRVMGLAAASHFIVNVGITEAGPSAFSHIRENYYYVFVGCSLFFLIIAYLYFPETRRKTLEEIAAAFGDKVVTLTERDIAIEEAIAEDKNVSEHVEDVSDDKRP